MYNKIEHTGTISEPTIVSFEIPKYSGCISLQLFTYNFIGELKVFYTNPAGIRKEYIGVEVDILNRTLNTNANSQKNIHDSFIISLPIIAAKLDLSFLSLTETSYVDRIIILT